MSDGVDSRFRYASDKLAALKGLMNANQFSFVRSYLKSLAQELRVNVESLFDTPSTSDWLKVGYLDYLSRYSNNLIQFSVPKYIEVSLNDSTFNKLFEKYVYSLGEELKPILTTEDIYNKVRDQLYPKITGKVNLDIALDATHFENLFASISVNFIGKNDLPVVGQAIDFMKKHYHLENDLSRFVSLATAIELSERNKGKYFVIGEEPDIRDKKNHQLWEHIRQSKFLEFVDVRDVDQVDQYIREHGVQPYFAECE